MTILFDSARTVKPSTFGRGMTCTTTRSTFEPSLFDRAEAAAMFDAAEQARYRDELEAQAQQAAWDVQFRFPAGLCELCGEPADWLDSVHKLCGDCLTAAEKATLAGQNRSAMGQYRVF
jgi:hypothetical protein